MIFFLDPNWNHGLLYPIHHLLSRFKLFTSRVKDYTSRTQKSRTTPTLSEFEACMNHFPSSKEDSEAKNGFGRSKNVWEEILVVIGGVSGCRSDFRWEEDGGGDFRRWRSGRNSREKEEPLSLAWWCSWRRMKTIDKLSYLYLVVFLSLCDTSAQVYFLPTISIPWWSLIHYYLILCI